MADGQIVIDTRINQDGLNKGVKEIEEKLSKVSEGLKTVGDNMTKYVTLPLAAMATGALKIASDFNTSQAKIQNSLGLTGKEADKLNSVVQKVWKDGFGASVDDVTTSLLQVKQNMKGLNDGDLEQATKSAMVLAKTFDSDVNEVTRAGGNIMSSFGTSSQEAFDLMAYGAQNGLNFSKEMFDNLAEYGPLFADAGYSADEMFQALIKGAETGTYNLDFLNDAVKEFGVKVTEGGKGFTAAMGAMSPETQKLFKEFKNGEATVKEVMDSAIKDLGGMEDEVKMNQLGVELFGTKWEDMGADAILAMGGVSGEIDNAKGSMDGMVEVQEQTFGQRFQSMLRTLGDALLPLGEVLMNMANAVMPHLASAVQTVSQWFSNLSPAIQTALTIFGMIAAVLGPVITVLGVVVGAIGNLIGPIMTAVSWFGKLSAIGPVLSSALAALSGPIGIVIAVIGALVAAGIALYKNWDTVYAYLSKTWSSIAEFGVSVWQGFTDWLSSLWSSISKWASDIWGGITDFFANTWKKITEGAESAWEGLKTIVLTAWTGIVNAVMASIAPFIQGILNFFNNMKDGVSQIFEGLKLYFQSAWDFIKNIFIGALLLLLDLMIGDFEGMKSHAVQIWNNLKEALKGIWKAIQMIFTGTLDAIKGFVTTAWDHIKTNTINAFNKVKEFLVNTWSNIKTVIQTTVEVIKNMVRDKFEALKNAVFEKMNAAKGTIEKLWNEIKTISTNLPEQIKNTVRNKFQEMKTAVQQKMTEVKTTIVNLWNQAKAFLEGIDLTEIGKNIIRGLINGIKDMTKGTIEAITGVTNGIINKAKSLLDINSPSGVFKSIGNFTMDGFIGGITEKTSAISTAMDGVVGAVTSKAADMVAAGAGLGKAFSQALNGNISVSSGSSGGGGGGGSSSGAPAGGGWTSSSGSGSYDHKTGDYTIKDGSGNVVKQGNGSKDDYDKEIKKLHSGGWVTKTGSFPGLAPDEVPAILQEGEFVLSRDMIRGLINSTKVAFNNANPFVSTGGLGGTSSGSSYDYSRKMNNTININSNNPVNGLERTLRRMAFEY